MSLSAIRTLGLHGDEETLGVKQSNENAMPMLGMQALRNRDLLGVATRPEVK